jgi:hypothetical protein
LYQLQTQSTQLVKAPDEVPSINEASQTGLGNKVESMPWSGTVRVMRRTKQAPQTAEEPEDESLATVTALSLVSSALVIFAPAASVWRVMAGIANEEEIAGFAGPYYLLFAQSYFWALYGMEAGNNEIANINIFGSVVSVLYLVVLAAFVGASDEDEGKSNHYKNNKQHGGMTQTGMTVREFLGSGVLLCAVISVFELLVDGTTLRSELMAYTALIFNIGIFLYPMRQCADALRKGTTAGFPVALSVAGFVSCALWAQYSALTHNFEYLIPNLLGCLCNGVQICVVGWIHAFRSKSSEDLLKFDARFSDARRSKSKEVRADQFTGGSGEQVPFNECLETS